MNTAKIKDNNLNTKISALLILIVGMILVRVLLTKELRYIFLIWNLFLAAIPLYLSTTLNRKWLGGKRWVLMLIITGWVLFYPNAPYLITDLFHLKDQSGVPLWYDLMLLWLSAFFGLVIGVASLNQMENIVDKKLLPKGSTVLKTTFHFLVAYGVYLGRFLRWNTWDVLINPWTLVQSLSDTLSLDCMAFTVIFGIVHLLIYQFISNGFRIQGLATQ